MPVTASLPPSWSKQKCLQILPNISWGTQILPRILNITVVEEKPERFKQIYPCDGKYVSISNHASKEYSVIWKEKLGKLVRTPAYREGEDRNTCQIDLNCKEHILAHITKKCKCNRSQDSDNDAGSFSAFVSLLGCLPHCIGLIAFIVYHKIL